MMDLNALYAVGHDRRGFLRNSAIYKTQ